MKQKIKRKLITIVCVFVGILILAEILCAIFEFVSYKEDDKTLYYNKTRLICEDKLNDVINKFKTKDYSFKTWKYPYAVTDSSGKVLYHSSMIKIQSQVNLEEFLQFDKSTSEEYKGFIKSSFPIVINDKNEGFLVVLINAKDLQEKTLYEKRFEVMRPVLILIAFSMILFGILIMYLFSYVINPILKITSSSKDIIKGKFDNYVTFNSSTEIGELSYAFELMRDEVKNHIEGEERLKKSQKEIIAAISHDLKTPLSSIRLYVEAIRDGMAENTEERNEYAETTLKKVDTLNKLIDDLLEHSKASLEVLSINKKEINIKKFLENIIKEIALELSSENIKFFWDKNLPDGIISVDELRINQVIFNLISNSIKYSKGNLEIKFKAEVKGDYLYMYIEDNGIGILSEDIAYIFDKFYRGDKSRNYKIPGSGLGLSTCKYIVEKHSGEIYCKSLNGKGSVFYFSIPMRL